MRAFAAGNVEPIALTHSARFCESSELKRKALVGSDWADQGFVVRRLGETEIRLASDRYPVWPRYHGWELRSHSGRCRSWLPRWVRLASCRKSSSAAFGSTRHPQD